MKDLITRRTEGLDSGRTTSGVWPERSAELEKMVGALALDNAGVEIGRVECIWEDDTHQAAFVGVRTGLLGLGAIHVIPAEFTQADRRTDHVRLPFSKETIMEAPAYDPEDQIDSIRRREVSDYYDSKGGRLSQPAEEEAAAVVEDPRRTD